jgi:peptide chain release factor 3
MSQLPALDERSLERETLGREVARRRTFAIISHPDAGKTTLTEKLLLYAGAIELAGAVRGRKTGRHATSDWMEIEQQRGISISAAALEFELRGHHVTLLDTPGHQDFSEDTYRTLLAVDSVVMVLDAAKGIEAQTLKLFDVCRTRRLPVLTFINKLDQPSKDPFELMDEIERVLGVAAAPMNWPLGDGADFRGVYDLEGRALLLYERQRGGTRNEPVAVTDPGDPAVAGMVGERRQRELIEAVEIISGAGTRYDETAYRAERLTPVFFGPTDPLLSGFVFKIQANMNPRHRDRVAFFRICSGRLTKDMTVQHERLGTPLRLSRVYRFFGRDRETVPEAYAGDVIGLVNPGQLAIGDTLYAGTPPVRFPPIPQFPAERFAAIRPGDIRHKRFDEAVNQLAEEGLLQVFMPMSGFRHPLVGVVGALQFDVIAARLQSEYGIQCSVDQLPYTAARWPMTDDGQPASLTLPLTGVQMVKDRQGRDVLLFASDWELRYCADRNPGVRFLDSL